MTRVLVVHASRHGATRGIAERIGTLFEGEGHEVEVAAASASPSVGGRDAVIVGSGVYMGSWLEDGLEFLRANGGLLSSRRVWLFSSGPLGTDVQDEEEQPRQLGEMSGIVGPIDHRMFFGALDRGKLGFGERMLVKAVKAPEGDFRDWDAIRSWADDIARELGAGSGTGG